MKKITQKITGWAVGTEEENLELPLEERKEEVCDQCGGKLQRLDNCLTCLDCGTGACSL